VSVNRLISELPGVARATTGRPIIPTPIIQHVANIAQSRHVRFAAHDGLNADIRPDLLYAKRPHVPRFAMSQKR
jgi:hypothetical protein